MLGKVPQNLSKDLRIKSAKPSESAKNIDFKTLGTGKNTTSRSSEAVVMQISRHFELRFSCHFIRA